MELMNNPTTKMRASLSLRYVKWYSSKRTLTYKEMQGLSSNPKGPLDDHVAEVAKKTLNPATDSSK
jgi:hypothetical protein